MIVLFAGSLTLAAGATTTVRTELSLDANRAYVVRVFHQVNTTTQVGAGSPAARFSVGSINPAAPNSPGSGAQGSNWIDYVELPVGPGDDVDLVNTSGGSSTAVNLVVFEV